jgi:hypothetical protein
MSKKKTRKIGEVELAKEKRSQILNKQVGILKSMQYDSMSRELSESF